MENPNLEFDYSNKLFMTVGKRFDCPTKFFDCKTCKRKMFYKLNVGRQMEQSG
jgi:hypothetical protein